MKSNDKIIKLVTAALMAAMTCVVTLFLPFKIPNTSNGYIHPGDAFVLLSGVILGPIYGGLAAGIGSLMADLFLGAFIYAPATFIIKAIAAIAAANAYRNLRKKSVVLAGIAVGIIVTAGYFSYDLILYGSIAGAFVTFPFNLIQNVLGIIIAAILLPFIKMVPQIRAMIEK